MKRGIVLKGSRAMQKRPDTVVFDVGNVLLRWKPEEFYLSILKDEGKLHWYLENVHTVAWNTELDRGLDWDDAFEERVAAFPEWAEPLRAYQTRWFDTMREPIEQNVSLLRQLVAAKIPTYAITNFHGYTFRTIQKNHYDFLTLFDGVVVSGEEKLVKPDPAIYELLCSRYGLSAEQCVFIDDNAANIATAQRVGMHGIHFIEPMDVAHGLRQVGFTQL